MKVTFWGVRGSIPTPGVATSRYGGNTPCVLIESMDGDLLVLDAGTGIRALGNHLLRELGDQMALSRKRYEAIKNLDEEIFGG